MLFIDKQEDIQEFVLTHTEVEAESNFWGNELPICKVTLGHLTFEDIDNISFIEYEEDTKHCVVVF